MRAVCSANGLACAASEVHRAVPRAAPRRVNVCGTRSLACGSRCGCGRARAVPVVLCCERKGLQALDALPRAARVHFRVIWWWLGEHHAGWAGHVVPGA